VQFQLVRYERGFTYKVAQKPRCQREFITRHFCMELHHTLTDFQHPFSVRESVMKFAVKALLKIPPHLDSLLHYLVNVKHSDGLQLPNAWFLCHRVLSMMLIKFNISVVLYYIYFADLVCQLSVTLSPT